ncbi:dihydroneopterin aldolase [Roseibium denhamense]|uniref:dihydroneopterin aldolase n=1 Tax=Roseibium denhamense TaxID=76305 RepID=A0ABY1PML9_9HYPH|nr:dihydroneopterin aldolase [Roseibium denhamense]MTI03945.1 dihydroneopterin aldolase [Roseibium denhamense]SMP37524.1 dihydroneopterin aldolase [Roseibium denhamense]
MELSSAKNQSIPGESQDTILVDGLLIDAEIGILDSEKGRKQGLRFDIEIRTVPGYQAVVSKTGDYVSYADTVFFIKEKAAHGGHVDLVEEWAEAVAAFVLQNPLADQVTVKVSKPDIFKEAEGVGIRITRRQQA